MNESVVSEVFLVMFAPERWTSVTKFRHFMGPPFPATRELARGTLAAERHFDKYVALAALANRLRSGLLEDEAELDAKGYSSADRGREYVALIETLFCELYASLDGIRQVLFAAYRNVSGIQNRSTKQLFSRAKEDGYGKEFPAEIREPLAAAFDTWFTRLYSLRTELTHGDIGTCHLSKETGKVVYMHAGLGSASRAFIISDVEGELNSLLRSVAALIESIFFSLCAKLEPLERRIVCGIYKGRAYERDVSISPTMSFRNGVCASRTWFEVEPGHECPLRTTCGAYTRTQTE